MEVRTSMEDLLEGLAMGGCLVPDDLDLDSPRRSIFTFDMLTTVGNDLQRGESSIGDTAASDFLHVPQPVLGGDAQAADGAVETGDIRAAPLSQRLHRPCSSELSTQLPHTLLCRPPFCCRTARCTLC